MEIRLATPWKAWLLANIPPAVEFLVQSAMVIVLALFMLLSREELRNRFIRLMGHGQLTVTTRAVDDASQRISRYLLMQLLINAGFGLATTLGLWLIGIELAPLWGFLVALLRYVPYIGAPIGFVFPLAISLLSDGWLPPVLVIGLYISLELLVAQVIEPWLFGRSIGVSAVALLAAAAFWSLLWGPVGLVLACPLTVCLVVLGKYVPRLQFLSILLADEPALSEDISFYQRLSARDQDEAEQIALASLEKHSLDEVFDNLIIPSLSQSRRDHLRGGLSNDELRQIFEQIREILEELGGARQSSKAANAASPPFPNVSKPVRILAVPAHDEADELTLLMLEALLDPSKWEVHTTTEDTLAGEVENLIHDQQPALVFLAAMLPGSLSHTRYLCKRLRAKFPELPIVVALWGQHPRSDEAVRRISSAGADHVARTFKGLVSYLAAWRPPLLERQLAESQLNS